MIFSRLFFSGRSGNYASRAIAALLREGSLKSRRFQRVALGAIFIKGTFFIPAGA